MSADDWIKLIDHVFCYFVIGVVVLWLFGAFDRE